MGIRNAPVKLAIFVVLSVLIATYMTVVLAESYAGDTRTYRAEFADASLLIPGQQVRVAGVVVGKVEKVSMGRGNTVEVTFDVDRSRPLTTATRAVVRYKDLIGNRYLELLDDGTSAAGLRPGDVIPASRTAAALDLDTLFNGFKPLFQGLAPEQINEVSTQLIDVLQGQAGAIGTLLTTVSSLTTTLANRSDLIGKVIDNLNVVLGTVADHGVDLSSLIQQMQALVTGLDKDAGGILDSVTAINSFTASAASLLDTVEAPLGTDLSSLRDVARTLNQNDQTVQYALDRLGPAYQRMMRVGSYGNFFNIYVCGLRLKITDGNQKTVTTPYLAKSDVERCQ